MGRFGKLAGLLPNFLQKRPRILLLKSVSVEVVSRHQGDVENILIGYVDSLSHHPQAE